MPTLLSVCGVKPLRIGGQESYFRELAMQLGQCGWNSVTCFAGQATDSIRTYLDLPNLSLEVIENPEQIRLGNILNLANIIQKHRPQIIHLYYLGFLGPYPWLARILGVRGVFFTDQTSRPAGYQPKKAPAWKRLAARIINAPLDKVVCVSDFGLRCMTTLELLPSFRFARIYNAVDLGRIDPDPRQVAAFRQKYAVPIDRRIVLQVSWIIPEKGIADLLQAARIVLNQRTDVQFVLAGEGQYRAEYEELCAELGIQDHVTWTGLLQDPAAEGTYAAADVVCQVSRWEEVFGWTNIEAMAFEKPVVATRVGGIPEIVEDGVTGFLVTAGNPQQIAEKILFLLDHRHQSEEMGRRGRQKVKDRFALRENVAQVVRLYGIMT